MSQYRWRVAAILATLLNVGAGATLARAQPLAWAHAYGSAGHEEGLAIAVDQAANSYVTGYFTGTLTFGADQTVSTAAESSVYLVKHNATGGLEWAVQASPDPDLGSYAAGADVAVDAAGNSYVFGGFFGTVTFAPGWTLVADDGDSVFLAKYNSSGVLQWVVQADGIADAAGIAVRGGNIYVTGQFYGTVTFGGGTATARTVTSPAYFDPFVAKYHGDGTVEWVSVGSGRPGQFDQGLPREIAIDALENVYIVGGFRSTMTFPTTPPTELNTVGDYDVFVAKFDASGAAVWAKSAGDAGFDIGRAIAVDSRLHVFVSGAFPGGAMFLEYDQNGAQLPAQASGLSPLGASAESIAIDSQDNRYVTGSWFNLSTGVGGPLLAKYSSAGSLLGSELIVGGGGDDGKGVALDPAGNAYVAGRLSDAITFDTANSFQSAGGHDVFIARYDTGGVRQSQTITFGALPDKIFGEPPITVTATASSGLPVSFASSGQCTVSGTTVMLTGTGSCTITASQGGDGNYLPAIDVVRSFVIAPGTPPVISIGAAFNGEGQSGTTAFTFNVTLSGPSLQTVTVHYSTTELTATAGTDFTAASNTLTFTPGQTTQTVTVQVTGDLSPEPDETFGVALDTAVNASISATHAVGIGTIFNDDADSIEVSGTATRALLLQTGTLFPATNIDGRYGLSSAASVLGRGVGTSSAVASLPAGEPSVGALARPAESGTSGTGAARAVAFYQYRNMTGKPVSFTAKAVLKGTFTGTGGHATGAVYVLDPAALLGAINTSGLSMPQFLVGRDTLPEFAAADATTFPLTLTRWLPQSAVLTSTFATVFAPLAAGTNLTTMAYPVESGQSVTIMFDLSVYQPPCGEANFHNTLEAAPVFLADENGNPAPLTPVGPMTPAPEEAAALTLTPVTATNTVGTTATVTAAAATASGQPIEGATVLFEIASGPNAGPLGLSLTDASGNAAFSYVGAGTGTDRVQASIGTLQSNISEITWTLAPAFAFQGFFAPVDMSTSTLVVWNTAKAGQAVPVKMAAHIERPASV